jgi:hypothetical protein
LRYTTVELDGTGSPAGGGPREPGGLPVSTGTADVDVGDGEGVALGEAVAVGLGVDAATTRLDRPGEPPWKAAKLANPRTSATTITATSAVSARVSTEGLGFAMGRG